MVLRDKVLCNNPKVMFFLVNITKKVESDFRYYGTNGPIMFFYPFVVLLIENIRIPTRMILKNKTLRNLFIFLETLRHAGTGVRTAKQKQDHEKDNGITNCSYHPDLNNNSTGIL